MEIAKGEESAVDDFATELLRALKYETVVHKRTYGSACVESKCTQTWTSIP